MLSREPAVDTGPKSASLLFEVLYADPDFRTHPPSTGQADPGGSTRYLTLPGRDTRVHPHQPRFPYSSVLTPPPWGGGALTRSSPPSSSFTWAR